MDSMKIELEYFIEFKPKTFSFLDMVRQLNIFCVIFEVLLYHEVCLVCCLASNDEEFGM